MRDMYDVIVAGSGAAGFSTADWLYSFGIKNICIVTEGINSGTSRNTGSDKQTYYKLDMCSDAGDSVMKMAQDFYAGGSMNGSDALIEAANSARCFMRLVDLGVPFPTDSFGRYAGYKTDHDNTCRATSAGPLTSKFMTEKLQEKVQKNGTEILDGFQAVKLIVNNNKCGGVICWTDDGYKVIRSKAVVLCTGAPAAMYRDSVYPESQTGATGLAVEAGAELQNFQEWQFGIASVKFRWNLSGSYQQVIPRYFVLTPDGKETELFVTPEMHSKVFLKGYQWPFDSAKKDGSSLVDITVFEEIKKGNRVFLDYRKNPVGYDFDTLSQEAKDYLLNTDCLADTPIERLEKLNPKAVKLYADHGIDLYSEPLEISVCAQHNNGGIRTDINSETSVKNLFAAGEAAGKFGVCRPGGSALNDTQVGGLRAAKYLADNIDKIETDGFTVDLPKIPTVSADGSLKNLKAEMPALMSKCMSIKRNYEDIAGLINRIEESIDGYYENISVTDLSETGDFLRFRLTLLSMRELCRTVYAAMEKTGSRGSYMCFKGGEFIPENTEYRKYVTITDKEAVRFVPADAIPTEHAVFEKLLKGE